MTWCRPSCSAFSRLGAVLLAAAGVLASAIAADGTPGAEPVQWLLDDLIADLRQQNPQLEQARQVLLAAQSQVVQADALPNAQLGLQEQANTGGPFDFNRKSGFYAYYSLTQPLLWPGKRELNKAIAGEQAAAIATQYYGLLMQLTATLKLDYFQLQALQKQHRFMEEDRQRLQQMKDIAKIRYANSAAAYVDYLNAQVAQSRLENDSFALDRQTQSLVEQINTLIGRPTQTPLVIGEPTIHPQLPSSSLAALVELALENNPALMGDRHQVAAADKNVELANKGFMPDLQLSAGAYSDPALIHPDTSRLYSVGVGVNLPTWGFKKEKAELNQATALRDAARANQAADRQLVELNVSNAYHALETALKQTNFIRQHLLPQAQMAWSLALTGYSSAGGTAFSDLLEAQSALRATEVQLSQNDDLAEQAATNLTAAIGREPD